jgi:hypothetical protein
MDETIRVVLSPLQRVLNQMACESEDLHIRLNGWWELEVRHFVKTCFLVPA